MIQSPSQLQTQDQPIQTQIEELRQKNELMDLAIDLAFKERIYVLLKDINSDPELVLSYMKMHERRKVQKLKEFNAKMKERDLEQDEKLAERRLTLEERKQTLKEKKFHGETQDLPEEKTPSTQTPASTAPAPVTVQPQPAHKVVPVPVKTPAPTPRAEVNTTR